MLIAVLLAIAAMTFAYVLWERRFRYDDVDPVSPLERAWTDRDFETFE